MKTGTPVSRPGEQRWGAVYDASRGSRLRRRERDWATADG